MESHRFALIVFATVMLTKIVSARAVNISNTWMLPEEGFPVFYRYFRDRISWYEADAVCQFHHANLVTADSTSQYDAIRAYLKELDIVENIWIGLSKTTEKPNFAWTDFRTLSGEGHWQQPIPKGGDPLCVSMDPAADFLWKPIPCGGPDIASFICELPVPAWAMGPNGCLLTELPSLTVLYIPEQMALELTSDCGLDGTKRIACKGDADREEILRQLTCAISPEDFDDRSTKLPTVSGTDDEESSKTTKPWIWTSNTIDVDYGMPTRHRRETEDTLSPSSTKSTTDLSTERETPSISPETDVTLDSSDKSLELKTTQVTDLTTQNANTEEQGEMERDAETTAESKLLDVEEYPSAIGQGQLFSIIENGTMFDIIEMNETTSDDRKFEKQTVMEGTHPATETAKPTDDLYTTVVYHKEPPSETTFVTNKSVKKNVKKQTFKNKDSKKVADKSLNSQNNLNSIKEDAKTLNKEVEMFPIMTDSLVKLNRTFRKELPLNEEEGKNITPTKQNIELMDSAEDNAEALLHKIDSKIDQLNHNTTQNNESELFVPPKPVKMTKEQFLPKSLLGVGTSSVSPSPDDSTEAEPQAQPRPNRQRQLTRPQRRSFYPYFFSRVLG